MCVISRLALTAYTDGRLRFGMYVNSDDNKHFGGSLACVQLYSNGMSLDQLDGIWRDVPAACSESGSGQWSK